MTLHVETNGPPDLRTATGRSGDKRNEVLRCQNKGNSRHTEEEIIKEEIIREFWTHRRRDYNVLQCRTGTWITQCPHITLLTYVIAKTYHHQVRVPLVAVPTGPPIEDTRLMSRGICVC